MTTLRLLPLIALLLAGCDRGPKLYAVTGTVLYQGKPLVKGTIHFDPDPRSNVDGQSMAGIITDGLYRVGGEGKGVLGGAYIIRIEGYDGVRGPELPYGHKTLKDYQENRDLPTADSEQNFDIKK